LCVIWKPRKLGVPGQLGTVAPNKEEEEDFELLHIMLPRCVYISGVNSYVIFNVWASAAWVLRLCAVLAVTTGVY